jgi:peroxiredoxin
MSMRPFRAFLPAVALSALLVCAGAHATPAPGKPAPLFTLRTGDDKTLTSDLLGNKVVVLFYEPKSTRGRKAKISGATGRVPYAKLSGCGKTRRIS